MSVHCTAPYRIALIACLTFTIFSVSAVAASPQAADTKPTVEQMKKAIVPFEKIRKAVGDKMEIMVEFHSMWNLPTAKKLAKALEPYNPTWFEDPIRMNSPQALAEYARN